MSRRKVLAGVAVAAVLAVTGCDQAAPPGESSVDVDTPALRELKQQAGIEDCAPGPGGGDLPAVTLPCLGGGSAVDLSSLTGPMVINFWASNCGPCRQEMPALQDFHERYGDQVAVLGIDYVDTLPGAALDLMEQTGATYPSVADPGDELAEQGDLVVRGLPQFVLLDADGRVAFQGAGGVETAGEVVAMVEEHLGLRL